MTPRKKAGPKLGAHVAIQLTDQDWHQIAFTIDPDVSIADRTRLPQGYTLRQGVQMAIELVLNSESGLTTREIRADLQNAIEKIRAEYNAMHPQTRELFDKSSVGAPGFFIRDLLETQENALAEIRATEKEVYASRRDEPVAYFLKDIIWLVGLCPNIRSSLPSKGYDGDAKDFPVFRAAREAVKIASVLAERHAPASAKLLKQTHNCANSTFVSKLHRANKQFPMISVR